MPVDIAARISKLADHTYFAVYWGTSSELYKIQPFQSARNVHSRRVALDETRSSTKSRYRAIVIEEIRKNEDESCAANKAIYAIQICINNSTKNQADVNENIVPNIRRTFSKSTASSGGQ